MKHSNLLTALMFGKWFIDPRTAFAQKDIVDKLLNREFSGDAFAHIYSEKNPLHITAEGDQRILAESSQYDKIAEGTTAIFPLIGPMLKYGTLCSYGTLEIAEAIKEAAKHKNIDSFLLNIDSGGGSVDAIPPMIDAIKFAQSMGKPVVALVDLCASAAYYTAIYCNEIIADNDLSSEIGSVGVMMSFTDYQKYYKEKNIEQHIVYSNLSDWKNLTYRKAITDTKEGEDPESRYDLLKSEELDPLAEQFQTAVRNRRSDKLKTDTEGILSGRMFFAKKAVEKGLIDGIGDISIALKRAKKLRELNIVNQYINSKN